MRQLHMLVNVLLDAKLSEQNLFMLYIDLSSAHRPQQATANHI